MHVFDYVKAAGTAAPSFTSAFLEELSYMSNAPADEEDVIRGTGSSAYAAGSDTVKSHQHCLRPGYR